MGVTKNIPKVSSACRKRRLNHIRSKEDRCSEGQQSPDVILSLGKVDQLSSSFSLPIRNHPYKLQAGAGFSETGGANLRTETTRVTIRDKISNLEVIFIEPLCQSQ